MNQVERSLKKLGSYLILASILVGSIAAHASSGISYHGRIIRPDGVTPVNSPTTQFRIQVRTPGGENCLLWEEQQTKDLSLTNGVFTVTIADTAEPTLVANTLPFPLERVFSNRTPFSALTGCSIGSTYNPTGSDGRSLLVYFRENPTDSWEQMPVTKVNFVPLALNSVQLEGYAANEFLKVDPASSYTTLSAANVNTLVDIISGNSNLYLKPATSFSGDVTGVYNSTVVERIRGTGVVATAPTSGQVLKFNGTSWAPAADDTGSAPTDSSYTVKGVVQINTDLATSGLFIAGGVLSLPNVITAGGPVGNAQNVPVITYDQKGRLTAVSTIAIDDTTKLPLAGGTMTGAINMGGQNITNANSIAANDYTGRNFYHYNLANTQYANVKAPDALGVSYTLTLPNTAPSAGAVLSTDASGNLSWIAAASGSVTGITSTNAYLTVDSTTPATPALTVNVGVAANTVAAGNDARIVGALQAAAYNADLAPAALCTTAQTPYWNTVSDLWACQNISVANFSGNLAGDVTGTQGATVVEKIRGTNVVVTAPTTGQVLKFDGTNYVPSADAGLTAETDPNVQAWAKAAPNAIFSTTGDVLNITARIPSSAALPAGGQDGQTLRWNNTTSLWEWFTPGVAGAGINTFNGETGSAQSLATGATGLAPAFSSATNVHTLNIPLASGAGVTSGTISKTEYDSFVAKLTSPLTTKGDLLSRDGTTHVRLPVGTDGQVLAADSAEASGLKWITPVAGDITSVVAGAGLVTGGTSGDVTLDVAAGTGIVVNANDVAVDVGTAATKIPQVGGTALGANGVVIANGTGNLASLNCTIGQVIKFDVSGYATCGADDSGGVGAFVNTGNSFGADATLGTNDNFALNIETNNTTKMTILADGRIGINNPSPVSLLHAIARPSSIETALFEGSNWGHSEVTIRSGSGGGSPILNFQIPSTANYMLYMDAGGLNLNPGSNINSPDARRAYFDTGGNLGLQNQSPTSALDINGATTQRGMAAPAVSPAGQGRMYFDSTSNKYRVSQNGGAYTDLIPAGGIGDILNGGNTFGAAATIGTNDAFALNFETQGTNKMTILPNGNVGIGETNPTTKLRVAGEVTPDNMFIYRWTNASQNMIELSSENGANGAEQKGIYANLDWGGAANAGSALYGGHLTLDLYPSGTLGNAVGLETSINATSGTVTNAYGLKSAVGSTGVVTNAYGLHIGNVQGTTTRHSIYTTDAAAPVSIASAIDQRGMAAPAVSAAGQGRIYFDSTSNKYRVSQNGGAYTDLIPAGGIGDILNGGNSFGAAATIGTNDNHQLNFETNGTTKIAIGADGGIDFGGSNPPDTLTIGFKFDRNPWNVTTGNYANISNTALFNGASNNGTTTAVLNESFLSNNTSKNNAYAAQNRLGLYEGTLTNGVGSLNEVVLDNSATSATMASGTRSLVTARAGTTTTANAYHADVDVSTGTVTNARGLYIDALQGTNRWGIYQNGTADNNYFAGNIGIGSGVTAPSTALDINGATTQRGMAAPAVSPAGQGRIYFDSTSNTFRVSQNGGAYTDLVNVAGATNIDGLSDAISNAGLSNLFLGTGVGASATGTSNTGVGLDSLQSLTTGTSNVAIGRESMNSTTTGSNNTVVGMYALPAHVSGDSNTAIGGATLSNLTAGTANTAIGLHALRQVATGSDNTALGFKAGENANGASGYNIFIGRETGPAAPAALTDTLWIHNASGDPTIYGDLFNRRIGLGGMTNPSSTLDINGAVTQRGMTAPAVSTAGQGRVYFDSTSNTYRVSQNGGAYVDLIPTGGAVGGTGTTNAIPKFTAAGTIGDSAIVDNGTVITATRSIASATNPIATGAAINLATSNTHTLTSVGGSTITVTNPSNGGVYNIVVEDTTSRTYTFSGCTTTYFKPANAPTAVGTRTVYGLMTIQKGGNWDCYVTWSTGFQ